MTNQEFSDYIRRNFKISFDIKNWKEDALWAKVIEFGVPIDSKEAFTEFKEFLGLKNISSSTVMYWEKRGWTAVESYVKYKEISKERLNRLGKRKSPFDWLFYIDRVNPNTGVEYTEEEAKYRANSIRPICWEYYAERGFDHEEAIVLARERKQANDRKGAEGSSKSNHHKISNPRSLLYHTLRGVSEDDASRIISEIQITFSLDICVEKYGEIEGRRIWEERQRKWQACICGKDSSEKERINKEKRNSLVDFIRRHGEIEGLKRYKKKIDKFRKSPVAEMTKIDEMIRTYYEIFGQNNLSKERIEKICDLKYHGILQPLEYASSLLGLDINNWDDKTPDIIITPRGRFSSTYHITEESGETISLRSGKEFLFYKLLKNKNISFETNKRYPNSSLYYDFLLTEFGCYVEICGFMNEEEYASRMRYKEKTFGSILLETEQQMIDFVNGLK